MNVSVCRSAGTVQKTAPPGPGSALRQLTADLDSVLDIIKRCSLGYEGLQFIPLFPTLQFRLDVRVSSEDCHLVSRFFCHVSLVFKAVYQ